MNKIRVFHDKKCIPHSQQCDAYFFAADSAVFASGDNTANLRADGWRVLEKSDRQDKLPGSAPYEKLPQVIQISPSILAREGQRKVCDMASASLKERISETCHAE